MVVLNRLASPSVMWLPTSIATRTKPHSIPQLQTAWLRLWAGQPTTGWSLPGLDVDVQQRTGAPCV